MKWVRRRNSVTKKILGKIAFELLNGFSDYKSNIVNIWKHLLKKPITRPKMSLKSEGGNVGSKCPYSTCPIELVVTVSCFNIWHSQYTNLLNSCTVEAAYCDCGYCYYLVKFLPKNKLVFLQPVTQEVSLVIEINWFWTFGDQSYPGPEGSHKEELPVFVWKTVWRHS
jgi:hypothetical protein